MTAFLLVIAAVWVVCLFGLWVHVRRAPLWEGRPLMPTLTDGPARRPKAGKW